MSDKEEYSIFSDIDLEEELISSTEVEKDLKPSKKDLDKEQRQLENKLLAEELTELKKVLYSYLKHKMFFNDEYYPTPSLLPDNKGGVRNAKAFEDYQKLFDIYLIVKSTIDNIDRLEFNDIFNFVPLILHIGYFNKLVPFKPKGRFNEILKVVKTSDKSNFKKKYEKGFSSYFLSDGGKSLGKYNEKGELEKGKVLRELIDFNVLSIKKDKIVFNLDDKPLNPTAEYLEYLQNFFTPNMEQLIPFKLKGIEVIRYTKDGITKGFWVNKRLENIINWLISKKRFTDKKILDAKKSTKTKPVFKAIKNAKEFGFYCIGSYDCKLDVKNCKHPRKAIK